VHVEVFRAVVLDDVAEELRGCAGALWPENEEI